LIRFCVEKNNYSAAYREVKTCIIVKGNSKNMTGAEKIKKEGFYIG
jgi:hypothetical protein